ncbi:MULTISPECIES: hypothetical protein [Brevibacillus]|uniref:hypothetical protein n=1 Tax=Brevibacillus TaxID=55080 RepID=UPI0018DD455C|nr:MULTISPECIES: hypothetical protein [Brevibacillus]
MRNLFMVSLMTILLLMGCSSNPVPTKDQVLEIISAYNKAKYELNDKDLSIQDKQELYPVINDRAKPYLTEDNYKTFTANREGWVTVEEAKLNQIVKVKDITIDKIVETDDKKAINVDYKLTISISAKEDTTQTKDHSFAAQVTITKENDSLKISRHWESLNAGDLGL